MFSSSKLPQSSFSLMHWLCSSFTNFKEDLADNSIVKAGELVSHLTLDFCVVQGTLRRKKGDGIN